MKAKSKIQLVLWTLLFVVTMSFSAYGADGQIKIGQTASTTFPIVINQPGSYVLTSNIVVSDSDVNAIEITTDNVTLDLNGFAIIGPNSGSGDGIYANSIENVVVINGIVRDFGGCGIDFRQCSCIIKNIISSSNNSVGIYVGDNSSSASTIQNCIVKGNCRGMYFSYSTVNCCTIKDNHFEGLVGYASTINKCTVSSNGAYGMRADLCLVTNCTVLNNGSHGIFSGRHESYIRGNNIRWNGTSGTGYGIYLLNERNYVIKNAASNNKDGNFHARLPDKNYMPTSLTARSLPSTSPHPIYIGTFWNTTA